MHMSQWGLNILIHSFFLFLKTLDYYLDGIEPRIFFLVVKMLLQYSWDYASTFSWDFVGFICIADGHRQLAGNTGPRFLQSHSTGRPSAQATIRSQHRRAAHRLKPRSGVNIDGPPIGSSHDPESTSTDRPSAQATVLSPLDGPPIGSSHDPESTSTDRPSAQATIQSQHRIDGPPIGSSHGPESNILYI